MRNVWQHFDALATEGARFSARVFTLLIFRPQAPGHFASPLGVSAQMYDVGVPTSHSQPHLHSHHSWDGIAEMVATV